VRKGKGVKENTEPCRTIHREIESISSLRRRNIKIYMDIWISKQIIIDAHDTATCKITLACRRIFTAILYIAKNRHDGGQIEEELIVELHRLGGLQRRKRSCVLEKSKQ
tara:strand:+ start:159 stop:485 length:327 start_codon:yes stop_codon:yes gene_type:complete